MNLDISNWFAFGNMLITIIFIAIAIICSKKHMCIISLLCTIASVFFIIMCISGLLKTFSPSKFMIIEDTSINKISEYYLSLNGVQDTFYKNYNDKNIDIKDKKYYYDTISIKLKENKVPLSQALDKQFNILYDAECTLNKRSKYLELNGALTYKPSIKDGESVVSIGNYILSKKTELNDFINNGEVKLEIIYNEDTIKDNYISEYIIINANERY